jgi:hypothetical protein
VRYFIPVFAAAGLVVVGYTAGAGGRTPRAGARTDAPVPWTAFDALDDAAVPPKVARAKFDRVHSGMTLRELTALLGRGWMYKLREGCGIITWDCEDGRQFRVWPTTYHPEEVIDAGPRQIAGSGGRGRMWMTRLGKGRKLEDLPIPPK